jgi:hypothetical protein
MMHARTAEEAWSLDQCTGKFFRDDASFPMHALMQLGYSPDEIYEHTLCSERSVDASGRGFAHHLPIYLFAHLFNCTPRDVRWKAIVKPAACSWFKLEECCFLEPP